MRISVSFTVAITVLAGGTALPQGTSHALRPQIGGDWWQIAGDPDLGKYTSENSRPWTPASGRQPMGPGSSGLVSATPTAAGRHGYSIGGKASV